MTLKGHCSKCGACCKYLVLRVPKKLYGKKDIKTWLKYHGIEHIRTNQGWMELFIPLQCTKLKKNLCSIHGRRPKMCKDYPVNKDQLLESCSYHE